MNGNVLVALVALFALSACSPPRPSVRVSRPVDPPSSVAIRNVAVLDVESGELAHGRDVIAVDGRITAIRPTSGTPPEADLVIPGDGATLLPGLIDSHGHVSGDSAPTWLRGFPDVEANLRSYLYSGITTVLDPGDSTPEAFDRRDQIAAGELIGPRIFTAGPILTCTDGHPIALVNEFAPWWIAWYLAPRVAKAIDTPEQAYAEVDELAASGANLVKIAIDQIPLGAPRLKREVIEAVVERARSHGLRTVAHVGAAEDAIAAGEAGVDAWVHAVYKERLTDFQLAKLAAFDIPVVATIEVFDRYGRSGEGEWNPNRLESESVPAELLDAFYPTPDDFEVGSLDGWLEQTRKNRQVLVENVRRMHEAGITVLAGSDAQSGVFPGPGLHRELGQLVKAGFTRAEAIRAATLDAARFIANSDAPDFGRVAVGQRADLLLVNGDPTRDLAALQDIREVFLEGIPLQRAAISPKP